MIEGMKLDFTTKQLENHLLSRISHHEERTKFYCNQVTALRAGNAESQQYTNGDPIRSLSDSMRKHQNRQELFEVMLRHLVPDEVYRLDEDDLLKLEIMSRGYFYVPTSG